MDSASLLASFRKQASRFQIIWTLAVLREQAPRSQSYNRHMEAIYKVYLHNPPHYFVPNAMYMVTGSILHKQHLLSEDRRKEFFLQTLFKRANLLFWNMEAWSALDNHYHFVAQAPEDAMTLVKLLQQVHSITAIQFNKWDKTPGRPVWQNYWDTCITHEKSYLARLRYVHENPVKHGLVDDAINYPFCSYRWFIEQSDNDLREQVINQPIDKVNVFDDF